LQRTKYAGMLTDITERRRAFEHFFSEGDTGLVDPDGSYRRAREALAREALTLARRSLDRGDRANAIQLADLAEETFPAMRGGRPWRNYERRLSRDVNGLSPSLGQQTWSIADALTVRLRRRRWRRYGL
jgi:hypothetical protein